MNRSRMPPKKEPKEQVVYAASKRKAPPFKPQRPSQVPRIPTTESESSRARASRKSTAPAKRKPAPSKIVEESEDDEVEDKSDSDDQLEDDPLASRPQQPSRTFKPPGKAAPAPAKRKPTREPSPMNISSSSSNAADSPSLQPQQDRPPSPTQNDTPVIPQPLLIRLLHEHFADPNTKIDKHAMQVLEKYFEVFVRETIARASLRKQEDAAAAAEGSGGGTGGEGDGLDVGWLDLADLEKVAAGMMLDF